MLKDVKYRNRCSRPPQKRFRICTKSKLRDECEQQFDSLHPEGSGILPSRKQNVKGYCWAQCWDAVLRLADEILFAASRWQHLLDGLFTPRAMANDAHIILVQCMGYLTTVYLLKTNLAKLASEYYQQEVCWMNSLHISRSQYTFSKRSHTA